MKRVLPTNCQPLQDKAGDIQAGGWNAYEGQLL